MENFSNIFLTFSKKKLNLILDFLWKCSQKYNKTDELFKQFKTSSNLHYNTRYKIIALFINENSM